MSFLKKFFRAVGWIFFIVIGLLVLYLVVTQVRVAYYKKIYTKCDGIYGDRDCKWNEHCEFSKYAYPMGNCSGEWCVHVPIAECVALPPGKVIHYWQGDYKRWEHFAFDEKKFTGLCLAKFRPVKGSAEDAYGRCKVLENGKVIQETYPQAQ